MAQGTTEQPEVTNSASVLQVQHQIRANASELQDYFSDLYSWEKTISKEEEVRKKAVTKTSVQALPRPRTRQVATVKTTPDTPPASSASRAVTTPTAVPMSGDAHTYDKGYKKWEKFDVDAALGDADEDARNIAKAESKARESPQRTATKTVSSKAELTPSISGKSRVELDKEDGNAHYKRGDYVAAIKSYTRALGFNSQNAVVLSNRAMAYLKNREYSKAEDDCSLALKVDSKHGKSFARRGTARNALGKHNLALLDFECALELDPYSKQIRSQIMATKELMRTAIKRAPKRVEFDIEVVGESVNPSSSLVEDSIPHEDKENAVGVTNTNSNAKAKPKPMPPTLRVPKQDTSSSAATEVSRPNSQSTPSVPTLPQVPKKTPTTSYEFGRVWKTLAPRGDADRVRQMWELRGSYLRLLPPSSLASVFKNSIDSEILCDIFTTIRQTFDVDEIDRGLVMEFVLHLPRVPRFSMTVMFLSDADKADCAWVLDRLLQHETVETTVSESVHALKPQYGL